MPDMATGMRQRSETQLRPSRARAPVAKVAMVAAAKLLLTTSPELKRIPNMRCPLDLRSDVGGAAVERDHRQDQQAEDELLPLVLEPDADQERGQDLQHEHTDDGEAVAAVAPQEGRAADDDGRQRGEE